MVRVFVRLCAMLAMGALALPVQAQPTIAAPAPTPPPVPLSVYGNLPAVELISLSPSGLRYAAVAVNGEARHLIVANVSGGFVVNAPIGDTKLADISWAGDDILLITKRATVNLGLDYGGMRWELSAVMRLDLKSHKQEWVFSQGHRIGAVLGDFGRRQIDGRWYAFYGGLENVGDPLRLYRVDLQTGSERKMAEAPERETDWLIGADGEVVVRTEYEQQTGQWRLMKGEGAHRLMTRRTALQDIAVRGFGRNAESVVIAELTDDGMVAHELSLSGSGVMEPIGAGLPVNGFVHDSRGLLIGFTLDSAEGVRFFDPKLQARWKGTRKAFPGHEVSLVSYTDDLKRMVVFTDAGDDSGTYWMVDIATGAANELGRAFPALPGAAVAPTRMVNYKAADGLEMEGLLTLPPGREARGLPVVVMPHGGPVTGGDRPGFDWWAQAFAARGYAVFQPNFRGTTGYGMAFQRAAYGEWGRKMQTDISDGLAALAAQGLVDPDRACIVGASYGGYAALAGVTLQQGVYRCAASYGGVADLRDMLRYTSDRTGRRSDEVRWWRLLMGADAGRDEVLNAVSPLRQATRADAPILLVHGKDDTVVPASQSRNMERALRQAGKPVEAVELQGEDHWLSRGDTRLAMLQAMVAFVEKHNPPG